MHSYCGNCGRPDGCPLDSTPAAPASPTRDRNDPGAAVLQKLADHDEYAKAAVRYMIDWLRDEPEPLLAMARGRHAEGHYRYGDTLMFELTQNDLQAEAAQELADAVCYLSLLLRRSVLANPA